MPIGFASAGVTTREIDITAPTSIEPIGIPAGIIGTSVKGPAFVPIVLPTMPDYIVKFGAPTPEYRNGPLAVSEWLNNSQAVVFLRVLGIGDGTQRVTSGNNKGKVNNAGFVVGTQQPQPLLSGALGSNTYANNGGPLGRTHFLGAFMSQSNGSSILSDAGLGTQAVPVLRGVLMSASGVLLTLSTSFSTDSSAPSTTTAAAVATLKGAMTGAVNLTSGKQEFVMLLNGHKASDPSYPGVITASFDVSAPNYFGTVFNRDVQKLEQAGYILYANYDIHPAMAVVTGSGIILAASGANASGQGSRERAAFLLTGSQTTNSGTTTAPNYENFEDRFRTAKTSWIVSQKFGGKPTNLFKVWALSDGKEPNSKIKISIENIQPSNSDVTDFGTFDLLVRDLTDNDANKIVLEQWRGLSLDVSNPRFVGNIIGDAHAFYNFDSAQGTQKLQIEGNYSTRSRYIRLEISEDILNGETPESALPMGFRGMPHLITSGTSPMGAFTDASTFSSTNPFYKLVQMPIPFRLSLTKGTSPTQLVDRRLYWGVQFERVESVSETNASNVFNDSIKSFARYFPDFQTEWQNVSVYDNQGAADTAANGILDADRFNNNLFSLENIQVVTGSSALADSTTVSSWVYIRNGAITTDTTAKTRALNINDLADPSVKAVSKFTVYMQGGFDGVRIFNADASQLTNQAIVEEMNYTNRGTSTGPTVSAYIKALELLGDKTDTDIQLLTIPGIRHRYVTDNGLNTTQDRFDAMYIFDIEERDVNNALVSDPSQMISVNLTSLDFSSRGLNSSFGACYFPDVSIRDTFNNEEVRVPPSVAVIGAFSKNDAVGFPWFAPAGFTRGVLPTVTEPSVRLRKENMDALYSVNINPLVSFPNSSGPVIWGQKTVLARQSSLDRVNVRRLLIALRREVKSVADKILFEQNKEATLARFSQLVNPIFKRVQDQQGLDSFKIAIDTSTTTQADIENLTIKGKIWLVPTKTLEYLSVDFTLNNRGNFVNG